MTVLVAYATMTGSTKEIARWIAEELGDAGLRVDVRPAGEVHDLDGYGAVVLGAAMYAAGWHTDARKFAQRFAGQAGGRPVWMFSSGPLDTSADTGELPPNPQAVVAMHLLHAREHVTFGGRLSDQARGWLGFVARQLADEGMGGDFRNPARVRAWAREIAVEVRSAVLTTPALPADQPPPAQG